MTLLAPASSQAADPAKRVAKQMERHLDGQVRPFWRDLNESHPFLVPILDADLKVGGDEGNVIVYTRRLYVDAVALSRKRWWQRNGALRAGLNQRMERLRTDYWDPQDGGFIWAVNAIGMPASERKGTLAQVYPAYILAEVAQLTGNTNTLALARRAFTVAEAAWDTEHGGYVDDFERPLSDEKNQIKSSALQLHGMLAAACLYRSTRDIRYRERADELIQILMERFPIRGPGGNAYNALSRDWKRLPPDDTLNGMTVYGHTAEIIWYTLYTAELCELDVSEYSDTLRALMHGILSNGTTPDGGVMFAGTYNGPAMNRTVYWWGQTETMLALAHVYALTGDAQFLDALERVWDWTQTHFIPDGKGKGCWQISTDETGGVTSSSRLGANWKAGQHIVRALDRCSTVLRNSHD